MDLGFGSGGGGALGSPLGCPKVGGADADIMRVNSPAPMEGDDDLGGGNPAGLGVENAPVAELGPTPPPEPIPPDGPSG